MPQALLPMIPDGATPINDLISVVRQEDTWTYFCGLLPVFRHRQDDRRSFRMFTAQLCAQGLCTQAQIIRTFGVSKNSVRRSVQKYHREDIRGFYRPRQGRRAAVMTPEVTARAEQLLQLGYLPREVANQLGVRYDTLRKAVRQGRVRPATLPDLRAGLGPPAGQAAEVSHTATGEPVCTLPTLPTDQSTRSQQDAAAGAAMGIACTRPVERVLAALGLLPGGATTPV